VEPRGLSLRLTMLLYPLTRRSPDHALAQMPFQAQTSQNEDRANLKAHLEETLERLERRRGLSDREKMREGALRMLLTSIKQVK
jgi:hypothetical protein